MIEVSQDAISIILKDYLEDIRGRNPNYTMRSFAKKLEISSGALSEILKKNRRITRKQAEKIVSKLDLDNKQKQEFFEPFVIKEKIENIGNDVPKKINQDNLEIEHWKIFAILNLIETDNFIFDSSWIAKRLALRENEVREILDYLISEKLLVITKNSQLKRTINRLKTSDGQQSEKIKNGHLTNCDLAKRSIDGVPLEKRDFSSITMPIDPEKLPEAREIIRKFQSEIYALLNTGSITEVYKLNIQLFPLTNPKVKS